MRILFFAADGAVARSLTRVKLLAGLICSFSLTYKCGNRPPLSPGAFPTSPYTPRSWEFTYFAFTGLRVLDQADLSPCLSRFSTLVPPLPRLSRSLPPPVLLVLEVILLPSRPLVASRARRFLPIGTPPRSASPLLLWMSNPLHLVSLAPVPLARTTDPAGHDLDPLADRDMTLLGISFAFFFAHHYHSPPSVRR